MLTDFKSDKDNLKNMSKIFINKKSISLTYNIILNIFFDIITKNKDKVLKTDNYANTINILFEEYIEHYLLNFVEKDVADYIIDKIGSEDITLYYHMDKETNLIVYLSYGSFEIIENETSKKLYDLFISDLSKNNLTLEDVPYVKINTSIINEILKSKYVL